MKEVRISTNAERIEYKNGKIDRKHGKPVVYTVNPDDWERIKLMLERAQVAHKKQT